MSAKILILDDDSDFRQMIATALAQHGYSVQEATRTSDAAPILDGGGIDLLIVDGLLPDKNGIDFIRERRASGDDTRMIFVSVFWKDVATFHMLTQELNVSRVINKPFTSNELLAQVEFLLDTTPRTTKALPTPRPPQPAAVSQAPPAQAPPLPHPPRPAKAAAAPRKPATAAFDLKAKLAELRAAYREKLGARLQQLRRLLGQAHDGDEEALRAAYMLAHKLHGTSGAYGFTTAGRLAGNIEHLLLEVIDGRLPSLQQRFDELNALLSKAEAEQGDGPPQAKEREATNLVISTILVVDADPQFVAQAYRVGKQYLFNVLGARSNEEALDLTSRYNLDGALIDVNWPYQDPYQLVADLRHLSRSPHLPIGFVSAVASLELRTAAVHAGGSLFLQRPIADTALMEVLRDLASSSRRQRPTILVVDDDDDYAAYVRRILTEEGVNVEYAREAQSVLDSMAAAKPDLVLLDALMPRISGFEVCKLLRTSVEWQDVPVLFVTATSREALRLACFEAGGDDYLEKTASRKELLARINVRLDRARLYRERSTRDPTTTLLNRRALAESIQSRMATARRQNKELAFCLLDLDKFKRVNDNYGHLAGDRVLSRLGRLISLRFRTEDVCARWGGEEFVITLYGSDVETAENVIQRLLDEFGAIVFEGDHEEKFSITFSAGIASFPQEGASLEELVRVSDRRLYAAKNAGRCRIYTKDHDDGGAPPPQDERS